MFSVRQLPLVANVEMESEDAQKVAEYFICLSISFSIIHLSGHRPHAPKHTHTHTPTSHQLDGVT